MGSERPSVAPEEVLPPRDHREGDGGDIGAVVAAAHRSVTNAAPVSREISAPLRALVVDPINKLPEADRRIHGKVRSGEEIALAIPDEAAFWDEIAKMKEPVFFEVNASGQLMMMDGCKKGYGNKETFNQAEARQNRIVYCDTRGNVCNSANFTVDKTTGEFVLAETGQRVPTDAVLMKRRLPKLDWDEEHQDGTGEYVRMYHAHPMDEQGYVWVLDNSAKKDMARSAGWWKEPRVGVRLSSAPRAKSNKDEDLGSRGVLEVNLNLDRDGFQDELAPQK